LLAFQQEKRKVCVAKAGWPRQAGKLKTLFCPIIFLGMGLFPMAGISLSIIWLPTASLAKRNWWLKYRQFSTGVFGPLKSRFNPGKAS
jgi:hypothetical protein